MNIINNKINLEDFSSLIVSLTKACFFGYGFSYIFTSSLTSSIISSIIGLIISVFLTYLYLLVYNYKSNLTFLEKLKVSLPKIIYYIIFIIVIFFALLMTTLTYYIIEYFILTEYLTTTNFLIISFILVLPVLYLELENYATLTRLSLIIAFLTFILQLVNITGVIPYFEVKNIFPLFNYDIKGILKGVITFTSLFTSPLLLMTFIKKEDITDNTNFNKTIIKRIIISGLMLILIITLILGVMGPTLSTLFTYPEYIILKKIKFNFIKSIENLCFLLWVYYAFILCSTGFMFLKYSIFNEFNIKNKKKKNIITILIILLVFTIPLVFFKDNPLLTLYIYKISPYIYISIFSLLIIYLLIHSFINK